MRKNSIFLSLMVLLMVAMLPSCDSNNREDKVIANLKAYNEKLPVTFANEDVLDSVYYDGGGHKAVFNYVVNNGDVTIETLSADAKAAKEHLFSQLKSDTTALNLYKEFADANLDVRTVMIGHRSHAKATVELTAEEINNLKGEKPSAEKKSTKDLTARDSLDQLVDSINALCPDSAGRKAELTKVQIENNYLVYNYVYEESKNFTIDKAKGEISKLKASTDSKIRKPTPEFEKLIYLCIDNGLGIKHRYVGKSTKQAQDFAFSAVDLSKITKHDLPEGYEAVKERVKEKKKKVYIDPNDKNQHYEEGIY